MVPSWLLETAEMLKWVSLALLVLNLAAILVRYAHW
jgi:hypothetical protein